MNKIINGLKEGLWKSYYSNGKLQSECNFINGLKEGLWKSYHSNGKLEQNLIVILMCF